MKTISKHTRLILITLICAGSAYSQRTARLVEQWLSSNPSFSSFVAQVEGKAGHFDAHQAERDVEETLNKAAEAGAGQLVCLLARDDREFVVRAAARVLAGRSIPGAADALLEGLRHADTEITGGSESLLDRRQTLLVIEQSLVKVLALNITPRAEVRIPRQTFVEALKVKSAPQTPNAPSSEILPPKSSTPTTSLPQALNLSGLAAALIAALAAYFAWRRRLKLKP